MLSQNWVISECHDKLDFRGRDWGWDGVEIALLMFKTTLWQITINITIVITVLSIGEGSWPHRIFVWRPVGTLSMGRGGRGDCRVIYSTAANPSGQRV